MSHIDGCPTCGGSGRTDYAANPAGYGKTLPCEECERVKRLIQDETERCARIASRFNVEGYLGDRVEDAIADAIRRRK